MRAHHGQRADLAGRDHAARAHHRLLHPQLLVDTQNDPGTLGRGEHPPPIVERRRHRLLDQHVLAGTSGRDGRLRVIGMRSADVYCLHARIGQQIIERCIDATIGAGPPGVGSQLLRSLRHRIARSDDLRKLMQGRISAFDALRSDRPTPNQPNPHALHHKALLIAAPGRRGPTCSLPARGGGHRGAGTPFGSRVASAPMLTAP